MAYLSEFRRQLHQKDYKGFVQLWEEYCAGDEVDAEELQSILLAVRGSDFASLFGQYIDTALLLWEQIKDEELSYQVFKLIIDIETTNTPKLADLTLEILQKRFGDLSNFAEKIRLVGLKTKTNFQGAVSNFELLSHMDKGKFVFHTGGWGTGEILDISMVRQQLVLEFEKLTGRRDMSFANAFKTLIPLPDDHFLARRFGDPDRLEEEARQDPAAIIRKLLADLGPKTAVEIRDEMEDLVIPKDDWAKWWQGARAKIKKDTMISSPENPKDPFFLRKEELSHEARFLSSLEKESDTERIIDSIYSFFRSHPEVLKNEEVRSSTRKTLQAILQERSLRTSEQLSAFFLLEEVEDPNAIEKLQGIVLNLQEPVPVVQDIEIGAFKKRVCVMIRELRSDWPSLFIDLLFGINVSNIRDYLIKELNESEGHALLQEKLNFLLTHPSKQPELYVWYFQKIAEENVLPFANHEGQLRFLEGFLMLLSTIEPLSGYRDLVKKMHAILSDKRFAVVRSIIDGASLEYLKEFLLLVTKCHSFDDHTSKILHALAQVVQPSLGKKESESTFEVVWTTKEGYQKVQQRIQRIGTVETVENAREIEAARALGDLRENSEYKFALEKRSRLQGELKFLTQQLQRARIITELDVPKGEVGCGCVVDLINSKGERVTYTLLGPWDADPDQNILSLQSKFAQSMIGAHKGDRFTFGEEEYKVADIRSYFDGLSHRLS